MNSILFINPVELKPHEQVKISRALLVLIRILFVGVFADPLLVDFKTKTILDGHHRCRAARWLGLKKMPCYCINYLENHSVMVYPRRANIQVNKSEVIRMAMSGKVFPHKTTRHEYVVPAFKPLSLSHLRT